MQGNQIKILLRHIFYACINLGQISNYIKENFILTRMHANQTPSLLSPIINLLNYPLSHTTCIETGEGKNGNLPNNFLLPRSLADRRRRRALLFFDRGRSNQSQGRLDLDREWSEGSLLMKGRRPLGAWLEFGG